MTDLQLSKQAIRQWIKTYFDDRKLLEVIAFNAAGNMRYLDPCACCLGVTRSTTLHKSILEPCLNHYRRVCPFADCHYAKASVLTGADEAQSGYSRLRWQPWDDGRIQDPDGLAQRRLSAILRAELRLRERAWLKKLDAEVDKEVCERIES